MKRELRRRLLLLVLLGFASSSGMARAGDDRLEYEEIVFESKVLGEERKLWVSLPPGDQAGEKAHPVVYLLDAQSHFGVTREVIEYLSGVNKIPQLILVGIPLVESDNLVRDRIRDYSPTHVERPEAEQGSTPWQKSGQADVFRQFIAEEVLPRVEETYRTRPFRVLAGHSQGGLFAVSSLMSTTDLFQSYIAASPSLWWDDGVLVEQAEVAFGRQFDHHFYLSLASGDNGQHQHHTRSFAKILQYEEPRGLAWKFDFIENESHISTVLRSYYNGLAFVFRKWPLPAYRMAAGVAGLEAHFDQLSETYGYPIRPTERLVNRLGYEQVWAGQLNKAIELFTYNTRMYPSSANAYDSLAEGYLRNGQKDKAITFYRQSLALDSGNTNAKEMLRQMLE